MLLLFNFRLYAFYIQIEILKICYKTYNLHLLTFFDLQSSVHQVFCAGKFQKKNTLNNFSYKKLFY